MVENHTYNSYILQIEGLIVTDRAMYPVFFTLLITYILIMIVNIGILVIICIEKSLHEPMYWLFCNLPVNDIVANSLVLPRIISDLLVPPDERLMTYNECAAQAFSVQYFATNAHTLLMIMAFDRYVAICIPLRYTSIMNNKMLVKLTVSAWGVGFVLVAILIGLSVRLSRCRTRIANPFCDNASLFKLSCESVLINNIYGLTFTVVLLSASLGSIFVTYATITAVCVRNKNKSLNSKAMITCGTHLSLYLIMFINGMIPIILHRFSDFAIYRKTLLLLFFIIPGTLNPIIYGVQSKEIRKSLSVLHSKKCSNYYNILLPVSFISWRQRIIKK